MKKVIRLRRLVVWCVVLYFVGAYAEARVAWIPAVASASPTDLPDAPGAVASGVIHVHTHRSHDALGTDAEVVRAARALGLDFVFLTDHRAADAPASDWATPASRDGDVLLLRGQEIRVRDMGYVLVDQLDTAVVSWDGGPETFLERLARDSAFAIVAHPRSPRGNREAWQPEDVRGVDAWEVFDWVDQARRRLASPSVVYHLAALLGSYPIGLGDRTVARLYREGFSVPGAAAWDSISATDPVTAVGGLDMHPKSRLPWGALLPGYEPFFGAMVNHVALEAGLPPGPGAGARQIQDGVRRGNVTVSFEDHAVAASLRLGLVAEGGPSTPAGDSTPLAPGLRVVAGFPVDPGPVLYRVLRDGRELGWVRGPRLAWPTDTVGAYRVEVFRYTFAVGPFVWNARPWIFTNPLRVVRRTR